MPFSQGISTCSVLEPGGCGLLEELKVIPRNSLAVQWLGLHAFTAEGLGSITGQGPKIWQAAW